MKKIFIIGFIIIIIVGAGAFYGGMKYGQGKVSQGFQRFGQMGASLGDRANQGGNRVNQGENGFVNGEILSKDDKSVTVKDRQGGSKIVFFSDSTVISKSAEGSSADLEVGKQILVTGSTNSDGSITAKNIQISPVQR